MPANAFLVLHDMCRLTPLMYAAGSNSNPEIIRTLIEKGAAIDVVDNYGQSALMLALNINKTPEVVEVLIEHNR